MGGVNIPHTKKIPWLRRPTRTALLATVEVDMQSSGVCWRTSMEEESVRGAGATKGIGIDICFSLGGMPQRGVFSVVRR